VENLAARAAAVGQLWLCFFDPKELAALLKRKRFEEISHFDEVWATGRTSGGSSQQPAPTAVLRDDRAHVE
jgi:hypothetical protein